MDADRLEGPGRRVLPGAGLVAHRLADDPGELASPLDRARGDDGAGDAAGLRLLAIMVEDVGDFGFVGRVEELGGRSEEHTSELQSLMRISYAVFCLKKKKNSNETNKCLLITTEQQQKH